MSNSTNVQKDKPQPNSNQQNNEPMERRSFIKWMAVGWIAFAAAIGGYASILGRYLFPNVLFEPKQSFRAGFPDDYSPNAVSEDFKDSQGVWIVRDNQKIVALATICTHLGCTPNYHEAEGKFKCPCHGSGFTTNGIHVEGPAPRPLERYKISLNDSGEIVIDKTQIFQQEKGEWSDPDSFLMV